MNHGCSKGLIASLSGLNALIIRLNLHFVSLHQSDIVFMSANFSGVSEVSVSQTSFAVHVETAVAIARGRQLNAFDIVLRIKVSINH